MDIREQEIELRLRTAMDHAAPDPLDRILASCTEQKGTVIPMTEFKKPRRRWAPLAVAAALAVVCCAFGLTSWRSASAVASVVSLDVNPSIQLQVNKNEKVLSADALNQDAEVILDGMDLKGTQLKVAVNAIVGSLLQNGYLDRLSSAILISVEDDDALRAARLESDLTSEVGTALQNASAGAAVLSQVVGYDAELISLAQGSSISVGKAAMVRDVQALNGQLDFNALSALSVEELKQLRETGAPAMPVGKDAAAQAAIAYAGLTASAVTYYDVDPELDEYPAHYEVELYTANGEFSYDVDAWTGEVLKGPANVSNPGTSAPTTAASGGITADKAKSIALADAGVSESAALGLQVKQDWDDGIALYEVEFRSGGAEYEYDIRLSDGAILKSERDEDNNYTHFAAASSSGALIGEAAAQSAALAHAGIQQNQTTYLSCRLEYDDGRLECYEVEFRAGNTEYEYEIGPYDGAVWKAERETHASAATGTSSGTSSGSPSSGTSTGGISAGTSSGSSFIGTEAAKAAALAHAGVSASAVREMECELDEDDGSYRYEIEFKSAQTEYEYEIDARTGTVLKAQQDHD